MTNREIDRILDSSYRNLEAVYDRIKAASMNPRHKIWVSSSPANEYVRDLVDKLSLKGMMRPYEVKSFLDNELKEKEKMTSFSIKTYRDDHFEDITKMLYTCHIAFSVSVDRTSDKYFGTCIAYEIGGETNREDDILMITNKIKALGYGEVQILQSVCLTSRNSGRYSYFGYKYVADPEIKDVKFNGPATIVFWKDGTKTVVKCSENDIYDPEKAIMMAMLKKKLGNPSKVRKFFKKWVKEENNEPEI